jgi:hypothetical protein
VIYSPAARLASAVATVAGTFDPPAEADTNFLTP